MRGVPVTAVEDADCFSGSGGVIFGEGAVEADEADFVVDLMGRELLAGDLKVDGG